MSRTQILEGTQCAIFPALAESVRAVIFDPSFRRARQRFGPATRRFGSEESRYAGYTAWRAVVEPGKELLPWGTGFEAWGRGARFACAPIGKERVYWFATAPEGEKDGPSGSFTGARAKLLRLFAGWRWPVADLVEATEEGAILSTDIYDREPLGERWGRAW